MVRAERNVGACPSGPRDGLPGGPGDGAAARAGTRASFSVWVISVEAETNRSYRVAMVLMSSDVLTDPAYEVPQPPDAAAGQAGLAGMAWFRGAVVRFSRGAEHQRRRALVEGVLSGIDPQALRRRAAQGHPGGVAGVLTEALGLTAQAAAGIDDDVAAVAACYHPHTQVSQEADAAVGRLVRAFGGVADEATANKIALLVQARDATNALAAAMVAGRSDAPVPLTRRIAPDGSLVEVDLSGAHFGAGPHACPGRAHALALATGAIQAQAR